MTNKKFGKDTNVSVENTGLVFFTWAMLIVLFWDFGPIDLYDAIIQSLVNND